MLVACCLLALGLPCRVQAEALKAHLSWTHPPASQCPSAEAVERAVEALTGHEVFGPLADADVIVRGGAQDGSGSARAWFRAQRADGTAVGERELSAEPGQCASLTGTLALVLSILLDRPQDNLHARSGEGRWLEAARRLSLSGGVFVGVLSGATPRLAVGGGPQLQLAPVRFLELRVDASYWDGGASDAADERATIGARWSLLGGGLAVCPTWPGTGQRWSLRACLGSQLASLRARPRGLDGPARLARLLAQLAAELGASLRVQRFTTLSLSVGAAVSLTRPTFFYDRADRTSVDLHRPETLSLFARVALTIGAP